MSNGTATRNGVEQNEEGTGGVKMAEFMFELIIALLLAGLLVYLVRWAAVAFGLPHPIVVIVQVLVLLVLIYWLWQAFPVGNFAPSHPVRR
jgi:fatty acid desaturase